MNRGGRRAVLLCASAFWACSDGSRTVVLPAPEVSEAESNVSEQPASASAAASSPAPEPAASSVAAGNPAASNPAASNVQRVQQENQPGSATPGAPPGEPPVLVSFVPPRGGCEIERVVGRFSIEAQADFGVVQGTVAEGVVPNAVPRRVADGMGCQLLERRNLRCFPDCVGAETCGEVGSCIPYPRQLDVGTVGISGLNRAIALTPQQPGNVYFLPDADNPPYAAGSEIIVAAQGSAAHAPFALFGVGSEPLAGEQSWLLAAGQGLELSWPAASAAGATTISVELTLDQHGTSPWSLLCELPDTGSGTIPAALIDPLLGAGISGFPNGRIVRHTLDHVDLE
ncbi:MAG: hypothetical protein RL033_617, partial [Pseudomonadota bacterium]